MSISGPDEHQEVGRMSISGPDEHRRRSNEHQRARGFGGSAMSINRRADEHQRAGGHMSIGALLGNYVQALGISGAGNMLLGSAQQLVILVTPAAAQPSKKARSQNAG